MTQGNNNKRQSISSLWRIEFEKVFDGLENQRSPISFSGKAFGLLFGKQGGKSLIGRCSLGLPLPDPGTNSLKSLFPVVGLWLE
jgi:hypothetical protein